MLERLSPLVESGTGWVLKPGTENVYHFLQGWLEKQDHPLAALLIDSKRRNSPAPVPPPAEKPDATQAKPVSWGLQVGLPLAGGAVAALTLLGLCLWTNRGGVAVTLVSGSVALSHALGHLQNTTATTATTVPTQSVQLGSVTVDSSSESLSVDDQADADIQALRQLLGRLSNGQADNEALRALSHDSALEQAVIDIISDAIKESAGDPVCFVAALRLATLARYPDLGTPQAVLPAGVRTLREFWIDWRNGAQ